jgi:hypothetical protein
MRRREVRRASRFKGLYCQSATSRLFDNKSIFRRVSKQPERMSRRDGIDFTDHRGQRAEAAGAIVADIPYLNACLATSSVLI